MVDTKPAGGMHEGACRGLDIYLLKCPPLSHFCFIVSVHDVVRAVLMYYPHIDMAFMPHLPASHNVGPALAHESLLRDLPASDVLVCILFPLTTRHEEEELQCCSEFHFVECKPHSTPLSSMPRQSIPLYQ